MWRGNLLGPLLLIGLLETPVAPVRAQTEAAALQAVSPLDRLATEALDRSMERHQRSLGHVIERRRSRVFVAVEGETPPVGTVLFAMRPFRAGQPQIEETIAQLQVTQTSPGVLECIETERSSRRHAQEGDLVRTQAAPTRVLLAPCVSLVDLPLSIPQILAEKLRHGLRSRSRVELVVAPERESQAADAYRSGTLAGFLQEQADLDEIFVPVLLVTAEKLVLNVEAFSVVRRGAIDVRSASVELDAVLRSWIRAGSSGPDGPPGFRLLSSQLFPWRLTALGAVPHGVLALAPDSLYILAFESPGLRRIETLSLGPEAVHRRAPFMLLLDADILRLAAPDLAGDSVAWILGEERWPRALVPDDTLPFLVLGPTGAGLEMKPALQAVWMHSGGTESLASRWWPAPGRGERPVLMPVFADLDGNGRIDLLWSDRRGNLCVLRSERGRTDLYPGFGDVKTVQPRSEPASRPVLWLTDDVCCGEADRLHAAQLDANHLRLVWSSERFEGSLVALASLDLDDDTAFDLVVAEQVAAGTRLHLFMAIPGERTHARGLAVSQAATKE